MASPGGSKSPELGKPLSERDRKADKVAKAERKAERQRHKLAKAERKAAAAGSTPDDEKERRDPEKVAIAAPSPFHKSPSPHCVDHLSRGYVSPSRGTLKGCIMAISRFDILLLQIFD